jgi:trehalose PTS system EIIBC or EIIBCA component
MARDNQEEIIFSPLSGRVYSLNAVPDPTFAKKMMGDGIAIDPVEGILLSPVDGEIVTVFPTKHAIGIRSRTGVEILIHVGIDTVKLDGEGFEVFVKAGDSIEKGDQLLTFDLAFIREKAASSLTPVIITNGDELKTLIKTDKEEAVRGETSLLTAVRTAARTGAKGAGESGPIRRTAIEVLAAVGGKDNIAAVTHCVTRLRFALVDESKVDKKQLQDIALVKGSFSANGQFQAVIGQGTVNKVYDELIDITGLKTASKQEIKDAAEQHLNPLQRAIKVLGDIFIPILPAIVTAGLLMGINNILTGKDIFYAGKAFIEVHKNWADFADIINLIANTSFVFLPGLIGWSAVKRFGGSELFGIVLGLMLIHPALLNAWGYADAVTKGTVPYWHIFGLSIQKIGYQGQVLPVLLSAYLLAKIELWLKKRIPDAFQLLLVAPITFLIAGFATFLIIGPVTFGIAHALTSGVEWIFNNFGFLGGMIYGGLYAVLVVTGMHHTFLAVDLQLIASTGSTFLWPMLALSNISQGASALAMGFVTKDDKVKGLSFTSAISAFLGITEPAMFGVNLRYRYPFYAAMFGSAIGGVILSINHVKATSIGVGGLPGFLSIVRENWGTFFIGMAIVILVPFVLTFLTGKAKKN